MTGPAFDFDEPESLLGKHQQIHFVDCPVMALEFEIRPCPIRVVVRQTGPNKVERTPFPLVLRGRDDFPAWRVHDSFNPVASTFG